METKGNSVTSKARRGPTVKFKLTKEELARMVKTGYVVLLKDHGPVHYIQSSRQMAQFVRVETTEH